MSTSAMLVETIGSPAPEPGASTGGPDAVILVVEDDPSLRRALSLALAADDYVVMTAGDAETAWGLCRDSPPDLALVDITLPAMSGLDLCHRIRQMSDLPIIVVSARGDSHDLVAGLEAGADDYVVKPFLFDELAARIRALLRRSSGGLVDHGLPTVAGNLLVSGDGSVVLCGEIEVSLTRIELRLLRAFVAHGGQVLSREQLVELVWGHELGDDRVVDTHVSRLRRKLDVDGVEPPTIETVRGLGYRFVAQSRR